MACLLCDQEEVLPSPLGLVGPLSWHRGRKACEIQQVTKDSEDEHNELDAVSVYSYWFNAKLRQGEIKE